MTTTPAALADLKAIEQQARGFLADAMVEPDAPYAPAYVDAVRENRPLGSAAVRVETAITAVAFALMSRPSDAAAVREACAKVAEATRPTPETLCHDALYGYERARFEIAAAIRQGGLQGDGELTRQAWASPDLRDMHSDLMRLRNHHLGGKRWSDLLLGAADMLLCADVELRALARKETPDA